MVKNSLIIVFSIFFNPWIFFILKGAPILALSLIGLSYLSIRLIQKPHRNSALLLIISTILLALTVFKTSYKQTDWQYSPTEQIIVVPRHIELNQELGKLYANKLILKFEHNYQVYLDKYIQNMMENLDINLFFLQNHPRERAGVREIEKYYLFLLPIFLIALYSFIKKPNPFFLTFIVLVILLSGIINRTYAFGPILYFPLINTFIYLGVVNR